jgi:Outer membrane lipoprotein-sorting protein
MNLFFHKQQVYLSLIVISCLQVQDTIATINEETTGDEIMEEVYKRHQQFPYIYEEQSMVMEDRNGKRDTRKARRFSRVEEDGSVKFLLLFDYPQEVKGVALLANRDPEGNTSKYIYLPAFGEQLIESSGEGSGDNFLGTDFSVENLTGEILSDYHYVRRADKEIDNVHYFILDVYQASNQKTKDRILRRHFIRQDNLYITLTHHYDKQGRLSRIQSHHDLKAVDSDMWRANMILMEDKKEQHQSLIKISRRVFSHDYVPAEVFTAEWLYENYPYIEPIEEVDEEAMSEETIE